MAINPEKLIVDTIDLLTFENITTGELYFMMDEITDGTIENGSETVFGTGKAGVRLSALDRNKTSRFTANNGYLVGGAISAQTGSPMVEASQDNPLEAPAHDIINVKAGATTALLSHVPVGVEGAEVRLVYKLKNGAQGAKLTVGTEAKLGQTFTVDAENKTLTFAAGEFVADTEIFVPYTREVTEGAKYENNTSEFSKSGRLILDLTCRDVCDNETVYHTKFVYPNAKMDGNFSISIGDTPAVHAISAEALSNVCSTSKRLWEWYVIE